MAEDFDPNAHVAEGASDFDPDAALADFDPDAALGTPSGAPQTRLDHLGEAAQPWKHVAKNFMEGVSTAAEGAKALNPFAKERDDYLREMAESSWYDPRPQLKETLRIGKGLGKGLVGLGQAALSPFLGAEESLQHVGEAILPSPTPEEAAEFKRKGLPVPPGGKEAVSSALGVLSPAKGGLSARFARGPAPQPPAAPSAPSTTVSRPADVTLSEGQRTGELPLIQREQAALQGTTGPDAQRRALEFFEGQQRPQVAEAEEAVRQTLRPTPTASGVASPREAAESIVDSLSRTHAARTSAQTQAAQTLNNAQEYLRTQLSPTQTVLARTPDDAAAIVSQAVGAAEETAQAATNTAYIRFRELPGEYHPATFNTAAAEVRRRVAAPENPDQITLINPQTTPRAEAALSDLQEVLGGIAQRRDPDTGRVLARTPVTPSLVENARRRLNTQRMDAQAEARRTGNWSDARAMDRIMDEFDDLVLRKSRSTFTGGDAQEVMQALREARNLHRQHRQTYYSRGSGDKVGPVIQNIIGRHEGQALTPEQLSKTLYGGNSAVPLARRLNEIFANAPEVQGALKQGLLSHITEAPIGKTAYTPVQIANRVDEFTRGAGRSLTETYLSPQEIRALRYWGERQRQYGDLAGARPDAVERDLLRMTGADGGPRASIDDTMGSLFGSILRSSEYAPEMVRRLTRGANPILGPEQTGALREGTLRYAMQALRGEEPLGYKRIADNLHQLTTGEAGRALFEPQQLQMIGELRDLYRTLIVPKDGKNWSGTASQLAPVVEAVGNRITQAIATGIAHLVGFGVGTSEVAGYGVSKVAQRVAHRKDAREVAKQLPLIREKVEAYQKALKAYNQSQNAATKRNVAGAAVALSSATGKIGVDLSKIPTPQLPGLLGAEESTPGRAEGGNVSSPFDVDAFDPDAALAGGPSTSTEAPASPSFLDYLSTGADTLYKAVSPGLPLHLRAGLAPLSKSWRDAAAEGLQKSGQAGVRSYYEAITNEYIPENAVAINDAGEALDKEGNVIPRQRRPNLLPVTKTEPGQGWFGSDYEGAMPALADVWNTFGAPAKATSALSVAAKAGTEGKAASQTRLALQEGSDVYHGTREPIYDKFKIPENSTIDRMLGVHVAPDAEISGTFARRRNHNTGSWEAEGGVYPLRIPNDAKFLEVPQKGGLDQFEIERMVMRYAYKKDPEMLARYLTQARAVANPEMATWYGHRLAEGKQVDWGEGPYDLERLIDDFGGKPYNKQDRMTAADMFQKDMKEQGYAGLKYTNTAPEEIANATDPTSYIVFDPGKTLQNRLTGQFMSDTGAEGRGASQIAQATRESKYGQGWFYNPKSKEFHQIDEGDLGPHGDHDGWISIGENAKKLGIDERQAGALQTVTWGPRLDTTNPYVKKFLEKLPEEAKQDDFALYSWFEENRFSPKFDQDFEQVFGISPNPAQADIPQLPRIRLWPGKNGEGDFLSITNSDSIQGSPKRFVRALEEAYPDAFDNVTVVSIEDSIGSTQLTPDQFFAGRWRSKGAQFRADSGTEGRLASQASQALRPEQASFYSAAERAIDNAPQTKATPEQWLGWLRNQPGITKEEIEHLGLEDWAKPRSGANRVEPVSKEDFIQRVRERGLGLEETTPRI